jgi:citronellol/citronellal dehydrogenase
MQSVCVRGTFAMTKACYPHLKQSYNPHIINISPPMTLYPEHFQEYCPYTIAKYAVSGMTLGMAYEFYPDGVAVNSLWPRALIDSAAMKKLNRYDIRKENLRRPEIMGEAVCSLVTKPARACTGSFLIDDLVLMSDGVTNFNEFAVSSGKELIRDLFLPDDLPPPPPGTILKPLISKIIR